MAGRSAASVLRGYPVSEQKMSDGRPAATDVVVEPARREVAGREALHHDVGGVDEREEAVAVVPDVEVEHDAALAAVRDDRPDVAALRIAAGRLDLHHVGPVVAEHHRGDRSGEAGGEVDDPQPLERARHHTSRAPVGARREPRRHRAGRAEPRRPSR